MAKIEKSFLTPKWLEVKLMYENGTNGSNKYGTNFELGGKLDTADNIITNDAQANVVIHGNTSVSLK